MPLTRDVVEDRQVLHVSRTARRRRRAGTPARRTSRPAAARQHLVHAAEPAGVDLAEVDRLRLEELLEEDPVLPCSPVATPIGATARRDRGVAQHVVRAGRLLDPQRLELAPARAIHSIASATSQTWFASIIRLRVRADLLAGDRAAPHVVVEVRPDLDLDVAQPAVDRLAAEPAQLLVGVAEPAGGGGVGGVAARLELRDRARPRRAPGGRSIAERLVPRQRVREVAEVDAASTSCSGVMSASSRHSGLPVDLGRRGPRPRSSPRPWPGASPLLRPSQRSWLSPMSRR